MAKKVAEFLKNLIIKAGGNPEDEALKNGLSAINADLEISDEVTASIDNGLLSIATAKNNYPELKNHYFAQAYKGLDSELDKLIESEKLPDDVIAELKQETSSTKRAAKLATKLKELEAKKANAKPGDTQKLNDQIAALNEQLRLEKESKADIEKKHTGAIRDVKKSYALNQLLAGYKTIHDNLDPSTKNIILSAIIKKHLDAKKASMDIDDSENLVLVGENNSNLFSEDNRLLTPKSFLDSIFAAEKMLVVNNGNNDNNNNNNSFRPNGQHSHNNGQNNGNNNSHNENGGKKGNAYLQDLVRQSLGDLEGSGNGHTRIM